MYASILSGEEGGGGGGGRGKHTESPSAPLFLGLLQISLLFANESLEACNLQSVPSDAITTSTASKSSGALP